LRRIRRELDKAVELSDVENRLANLTVSLKRIRPAIEASDTLIGEELASFRQGLWRIRLQLKALQDELAPRSRTLEEQREELLKMDLLWNVTFRSLAQQDAKRTSQELTRSTQKEIDITIDVIRSCRPGLLMIQSRISEKRILADDLLAQADDAINELRARLLSLDSEPLQRAIRFTKTRASLAESIRTFYLRRALPLFEYGKDSKSLLWTHLLISLLIVWFFYSVSRGNLKWLGLAGRDGKTEEILRHPLAAALVLSLLLSFSIYPNAPTALYRLALLLMVLPLLRVVSGALSRNERAISYFLSGLFLLRRLDELFASNDLVYRIYVLGLAGMALFGFIWGARMDRAASRAGIGPWRMARIYLLHLGVVILLGSLIANIVGSVALATLLAEACIGSAFAGAAIFAGVLVFQGYFLPLFQSPLAQRSLAIRQYGERFRRYTSSLVRLVALISWIGAALALFGISGPILAWFSAALARQWSFGQVAFSLGGILFFVITIWLSVVAARFVAFVFEKDILSRLKLPQGIPATASMLVRDSIIAFGFVMALAGAGVQWSQIVLVASAIGIGVGLGLQHLVSSFIAGLILIVERPIRVGDVIELGNMTGTVTRIGLRSSTVQIPDGSEVICPNSNLISKELVNWTLSEQIRRVEVAVRVARGSDPDTVLAVLKRAAGEYPGVLQKPAPTALLRGFGESSLDFVLRFFTLYGNWERLSSEVGIQVNRAFREAGIEIPFPRRDIRIASEPKQTTSEATGAETGETPTGR
jgi:small-conductance mechanosensitive channel